jgi:hypothetical protein
MVHPLWSTESIAKDPKPLSLPSSKISVSSQPASQTESISAFCFYKNALKKATEKIEREKPGTD